MLLAAAFQSAAVQRLRRLRIVAGAARGAWRDRQLGGATDARDRHSIRFGSALCAGHRHGFAVGGKAACHRGSLGSDRKPGVGAGAQRAGAECLDD